MGGGQDNGTISLCLLPHTQHTRNREKNVGTQLKTLLPIVMQISLAHEMMLSIFMVDPPPTANPLWKRPYK